MRLIEICRTKKIILEIIRDIKRIPCDINVVIGPAHQNNIPGMPLILLGFCAQRNTIIYSSFQKHSVGQICKPLADRLL